MPCLSQGLPDDSSAWESSPYPVTEPGLSQSPPRETPALQLGHGETPHQGGDAAGEVQEEEGQGVGRVIFSQILNYKNK